MQRARIPILWVCVGLCLWVSAVGIAAPTLEDRLAAEGATALAEAAWQMGDAARGAIVFHQPHNACTKCHAVGNADNPLGPDLTELPDDAGDMEIVESVLIPSKAIRKGYETYSVITMDGLVVTGLLSEDTDEKLVLRDVEDVAKVNTYLKDDIDEYFVQTTSAMPVGQVNQLASRQEFLDLIRYLLEIRDGGAARAKELQPPASAIALKLPEYEQHIDHVGMISGLDAECYQRGEAIYQRVCVNCHGTHDQPGSLPTSLKFAADPFKNGGDPHTMYRTLTRGFGMMVPQTWMVPQQKYDVIHYIREAYLKEHNAKQYFKVSPDYLAALPTGDTRGPEPVVIEPWVTMDYGPSLVNTYEIGSDGSNFAYKGIAVRLDPGPGGISRGSSWMIFDHDTLRVAAGWTGEGFIDWNGIHFNGRHQVHPRIVGDLHFANPTGPGWANPDTGRFEDPRFRGRDDRPYGPLPREWAHYKGLYHHGLQTIIHYTVGGTDVLEKPSILRDTTSPAFARTFNLGPRSQEMVLQVARREEGEQLLKIAALEAADSTVVAFGRGLGKRVAKPKPLRFDGSTSVEVAKPADFDLTDRDFTITARIKTQRGGTIFSKLSPGNEWVPNAKALFLRNGRLCFDIGWVGAVESKGKVNDNQWHDVAMTWEHESAEAKLFIDGQLNRRGRLRPKGASQGHVVRLGFAAPDFPRQASFFSGQIDKISFYQRKLDENEIARGVEGAPANASPLGRWRFDQVAGKHVADLSDNEHDGTVRQGAGPLEHQGILVAGLSPPVPGVEWCSDSEGRLCLRIPPGTSPLGFTVWIGRVEDNGQAAALCSSIRLKPVDQDLAPLTEGGPPRWSQTLVTNVSLGQEDGPFAADVLTEPEANPWLAQTRLTGVDFFDDGDRAALSAWDGDVWLVSGLSGLPESTVDAGDSIPQLTWQRIASGLFQPLGLKIVAGRIHVICRDQLVILHDLNGDGETDFYENFNNDHQVTDHFHEFAMDLQTDAEGNFYYAKGARHALPALVPHHGTLLRVARDGSRTDILARGFRAPNGVCVNDDGTFFLTDQEGHWTPKNRVNLIKEGGYYGNFFGYHDVEDSSDDAMEQPVCWITNSVDRSPSEILRVDSDVWGPLQGSLLNLSYGYGKVYVLPQETVDGETQGGICELPIAPFPTGIMRGRFRPQDQQLYSCGMFAWAGNQQRPGGFYRIRYTGKPVYLPVGLRAYKDGMAVTMSGTLDKLTAGDVANYAVKTWTLKRTASYGSDHYDERPLEIRSASLSPDRKTVFLKLPDIQPTWCMEIRYSIRSADGERVNGFLHNTIHRLRPEIRSPSAAGSQAR